MERRFQNSSRFRDKRIKRIGKGRTFIFNTGEPRPGGIKSLQLQLNVLIDGVCEGCKFHSFPYTIKSTIRDSKNKFPKITFNSIEDVLDYCCLIKSEAEHLNKNNSEFSPLLDVLYQIPFFACKNHIIRRDFQKDITKYIYCNDTGIKPHDGSYKDTPAIWKQKHFLIKQSLSILQQEQRREIINKNKEKSGNR